MTTTNNNDGLHEAIQAAYLLWWSSPGGGKGADIGSVMEAAVRDWLDSRPVPVVTGEIREVLEDCLAYVPTPLTSTDADGVKLNRRIYALLAQPSPAAATAPGVTAEQLNAIMQDRFDITLGAGEAHFAARDINALFAQQEPQP